VAITQANAADVTREALPAHAQVSGFNSSSANAVTTPKTLNWRDLVKSVTTKQEKSSARVQSLASIQPLDSGRENCDDGGYFNWQEDSNSWRETYVDCKEDGEIWNGWQSAVLLSSSGEWAGYDEVIRSSGDLTVYYINEGLRERSRGSFEVGESNSDEKVRDFNVYLELKDSVDSVVIAFSGYNQTYYYSEDRSKYNGSIGYGYNGSHTAYGLEGDISGICYNASYFSIPASGSETISGSTSAKIKITYNNNVKVELIEGGSTTKIFPEGASATGSCDDFADWLNR
jgi:hypothetical protein